MSFQRHQPYNELPPLPPAVELESRAVLKLAISANRALATLKGLAAQIPNPGILINSVGLQEARVSSEIENIVTTNDALYRADATPEAKTDPHTKEVLRYREALWFGFRALNERPLSTRLFVEIVRIIKEADLDVRKTPGTHLKNAAGEIIYTPPEGEAVLRQMLANLENFLHAEDDLDPLVKLAVMHYQFETIHPFGDGNGRTGRILNILYLVEQGLLDIPVLFLSRAILGNKVAYYEGLRGVTERGEWEAWVCFMLRAVEATALETLSRIQQMLALMEDVRARVQAEAPRIYSKDLIEAVFAHPYCKIRFLEESDIAQRQTAATYLRTLGELGVLRPHKEGREMYYINDALLGVLTAA